MDGSQNMGWGQGMFGEPMEMMCGVYSWGEGWGGGVFIQFGLTKPKVLLTTTLAL
jgi:hypothetical protein